MWPELTDADIAIARTAIQFVIRALHARGEPTTAFDEAIRHIDAHRARVDTSDGTGPNASAYGTVRAPARDHGLVDTTEASRILRTSERWVRQLAPSIGGVKHGGRWWIPRSSLPDPEENT